MKITPLSIQEFWGDTGVLNELEKRTAGIDHISLNIRSFKYEVTDSVLLTLKNLEDIFYDYLPSHEKKRGDWSCEISGPIKEISFEKSKELISFYIYCGGFVGDTPTSTLDVPEHLRKIAEENVKIYWDEVARHFTLPPTRAYVHNADYQSCFGSGHFWNFCIIYLNDKTMEGVVLSGECKAD